MAIEHPFAQYVRILGKGKTGSRDLSREEAAAAFGMVLRGEVEEVQLGAFLMLLRVKEETPEEIAGFVDACRASMDEPPQDLRADIDWSSYAGKKHQHPWYLLSMLLLAENGKRVFVHGTSGHTPGRLYTEQAMQELGFPVAQNWRAAQSQLDFCGLTYLALDHFCPRLQYIMQLRPLLGLRSPVNTLARLLNPLLCSCSIQSIFHPAYARIHHEADTLLGQPRTLVLKGESGEVEVKPHADTRIATQFDGAVNEFVLPRRIQERVRPVDTPSTTAVLQLWRGERPDAYGEAAVLATTAMALQLLMPDQTTEQSMEHAGILWTERDTSRLDTLRSAQQ